MHGSLAIIGAGRVGRALGRRLRELRWHIGAVVAQSEATARRAVRFIGGGSAYAAVTRQVLAARVILITTPDGVIESVGRELARIGAEELRGKIVLHTSGALDAGALCALRDCGAAVGSMHPLQSFSGVGVPPLEGKFFAIEGNPGAVRVARRMVRSLGGYPVQVPSAKKPLYHAAAAMAAGHTLALMEAATLMLMSAGMKRREATRALLPLTRQVLDNFERLGPRTAWTGPLARGDYGVVASHRQAMRDLPPPYLEAYDALNRLTALVLCQDAPAMLAALENGVDELHAKAMTTGG